MQRLIRWLRYNLMYLGSPPWDTGVSPPELREYLRAHPPGRALDLGCGTGTNLVTMATAGWQARGIDFVPRAVTAARRRLARAGLAGEVQRGDVSRLEDARGSDPQARYDLVLDIGCYHGLPPEGREAYRRNLPVLLRPGGSFLLYANWSVQAGAPFGITQADLDALTAILVLDTRQDSHDRFDRTASWLLFHQE